MDLPCFFYHPASDRGTPMTMETPKYKSIDIREIAGHEHPQHPPGWRCCEGQGFHQGFDMLRPSHTIPKSLWMLLFFVLVFAIFIQCSDEVSGQVVNQWTKRNKTLLKSTFDGYYANIHTDQWDPTVLLYIHDGSRTIMISSPMMWAFMAFPDLCKRLQACTLW